jgi:hypothetical protein
MTKSDIGRTVATFVCTIVMSATCILGAVGPARTAGVAAPVAHTIV